MNGTKLSKKFETLYVRSFDYKMHAIIEHLEIEIENFRDAF